MNHERYQKALRFIYNRQHFGIKLGLENITRLADWLGNPQNAYRTVHVAGTNGKGSTASFIASILEAAGYRVGIFTSPHLADYRERIRINGRKISHDDIADFIGQHKQLILKSQVTFFEVTTALAFWYFERKKVDWAVLEVGLGGRLDATNIVTPEVAVITNISYEHKNLLGRTIYKIAGEKGGIIKSNVPVVTGVELNGNDAARHFTEICAEKAAPLHFRDRQGYVCEARDGHDILHIKKGVFAGLAMKPSLIGRHQVENAYLAACAAEALANRGFRITPAAVRRGLESNFWPGRMMTVRRKPTVIIDVAHNREGFHALTETLARHYPGRKFDFLVSMVEKKNGDHCLRMIAPLARSISTAPLETFRRDDPYFLISRLRRGGPGIRVYPDATTACKDLLENSAQSDILIITGSHFLVGEIASLIKRDGF
ncbi:MAG: bifunctional folylpolyglutamate synthase/dihydrofolate synthase [Candidatus Thorarchaeota archaeon]